MELPILKCCMCVHLRKLHLLRFTYFQRKPHRGNNLNPSAFTHINILLLFIHKNSYNLKWNSLDKAKNKSLIETNAWQTYRRSFGWTDGRTYKQSTPPIVGNESSDVSSQYWCHWKWKDQQFCYLSSPGHILIDMQ